MAPCCWQTVKYNIFYIISEFFQFVLKALVQKEAIVLKQPEVSYLIRQLRQLMSLSKEQFATTLGVAYCTVNRWEKVTSNLLHWRLSKLKLCSSS